MRKGYTILARLRISAKRNQMNKETKPITRLRKFWHPYTTAAHEVAIGYYNPKITSKKKQKAYETFFSIFLMIKTDPFFKNEWWITNAQDLIRSLEDEMFVLKLQCSYLSPWDKLFDAFAELFRIKKRTFSAYDKLMKVLLILPIYLDDRLPSANCNKFTTCKFVFDEESYINFNFI